MKLHVNPIALIKAKIVYNFGLYECNRVNVRVLRYSEFGYEFQDIYWSVSIFCYSVQL